MNKQNDQRERYRRSAMPIQPLKTLYPEDLMEEGPVRKRRFGMKRITVIAAAIIMIFALSAVSYAADVGGFKGTVDLWLYGEPVNVEIEINDDGTYTATYPDGREMSGGGIAYDFNGERPLTPEEILDELSNSPEVLENENGRIWFYYRNYKEDITEKVEENDGIANIKIKEGALPLFFTVKWEGGGVDIRQGTFSYPKI